MIIIEKPYLEIVNNEAFLKSLVKDEKAGIEKVCYYSATLEYGNYFCHEAADAFVVGLLLPALQSNQDIIVKASVSEKLYYNLNNVVIYALSKVFGYNKINIIPENLVVLKTDSFAVGTGCSLGVDSLTTIIQHIADKCPDSYKLTHLTFFNIGSHGEKDLEKVKISYQNDLIKVKKFAEEIKLPLVTVESNIAVFYYNYDFDFNHCHIVRNMSIILAMQKLFKKYIYSSGYTLDKIKFTKKDPTYIETIFLPALSNENVELIVGTPDLTRTSKIKLICENELVQKYLYVCVRDLVVNNQMRTFWFDADNDKINCTSCDKCLRTTLALEMFGVLEKYDNLFDIRKHRSLRKLFMAKVIGLKNKSAVFEDVYNFALSEKYNISVFSRILSVLYRFHFVDLYYGLIKKLKK